MLDDIMVVPCTSKTNRLLSTTQYLIVGDEIAEAGIRMESIIRCEAIFTLNQSMILRKLGFLSSETMSYVNRCLNIALQLIE
jgi:mRNA interferase MazF